jgi:hypothetical protein
MGITPGLCGLQRITLFATPAIAYKNYPFILMKTPA